MEVFFCDRCSTRVTEGDLAENRAFRIHTFILCKACWENSEIREAIERRVAEAGAVTKASPVPKRRPGSGRHAARRKTPRPASGIRRSPARGTPRRTPAPHGRRRTPGRTSPVRLERVNHESDRRHGATSRRRPDAPDSSAMPKAIAFAAVGLVVGLLAIFFLGGKKSPAASGTGSNATISTPDRSGGSGDGTTTGGISSDGGGGTAFLSGRRSPEDDRDGGGDMQDLLYRRPDEVAKATPGLRYEIYEGFWRKLPAFDNMSPVATGTVPGFEKVGSRKERYGLRFTGYVDVARDGRYTFYVKSDDGARLWIGDRPVVDNDGTHNEQERAGTAYLRAGKHAVRLDYFQGDGTEWLEVSWAGPGSAREKVPDGALYHAGG
ncbi:MAG: PA14 domain-containing protein [Planctomycetota bacterium]